MAAGFVHGVLNTDNMNINGESFDYGPYRFLPFNDPNFTAAYFDQTGLYCFGRQPQAVFWNLQQLAACLASDVDGLDEPLTAALNSFGDAYRDALRAAMLSRLGVKSLGRDADAALVNAAFQALGEGAEALRWEPFFFDWVCGAASIPRALAGPRAGLYMGPAFIAFREKLEAFEPERPERLAAPYFAEQDPEELLYEEIEAIWAAIAERDDWVPFEAKLARIDQVRSAFAIADEVPFSGLMPI
jgi:uncharacterized protein YdiU (UPF0061 family)